MKEAPEALAAALTAASGADRLAAVERQAPPTPDEPLISNREALMLHAADAEHERRVVLLWQRHHIPDWEIPDALDIPPSLWSALKSEGDTPPLFQIGRRLFVKTSDLRAWLDAKARGGKPGSKRLRNKAAA